MLLGMDMEKARELTSGWTRRDDIVFISLTYLLKRRNKKALNPVSTPDTEVIRAKNVII